MSRRTPHPDEDEPEDRVPDLSYPEDRSTYPIYTARVRAPLFVPVVLVCRVTGVEEPEVIGDVLHCRLRLRDYENNEELTTFPLPQGQTLERAYRSIKSGFLVVAYGSFQKERRSRRGKVETRFHVHHLGRVKSHVSLLGPTPEDLARIDALIADLSTRPGGIRAHLTDRLNAMTKTCTAGQSRRFLAAQLMVLLQALSCGMVPADTNDRISLCNFGASGVGKKKLAEQALGLAPAWDWTQPASLSQAGLTAVVQQRAGRGWQATPGKLPRTSFGAFICEDLHRMTKKDLRSTQALFMAVAEDGRVETSKAASCTYECRTALHLNANRQSILEAKQDLSQPQARATDIVAPFDLFSRMDFMIDLSSGDDASGAASQMILQKAQHILGEDFDTGIEPGDEHPNDFGEMDEKEARELKLLVARLKDRIPQVSLDEIEPQALQLMNDLTLLTREHTARVTGSNQETFNADSLLRRMANSARKIIGASARLNNRRVATTEDVDCAWAMLSYKLEVVKWLCSQAERIRSQGPRERQVQRALRMKAERWSSLLNEYGGAEEVSADEIAGALGYSVRIVQQELREHGIHPERGRYDIPTWEQYAEMEKERAAAAQDGTPQETARDPDEDDDEEPEELEAQEAEATEAEAAEEVPHFEDCIAESPAELQPLHTVFESVEDSKGRQEIAERLLQIATRPEGNCARPEWIGPWFIDTVSGYSTKWRLLEGEAGEHVKGHLGDPDWATRGCKAIAVYAASCLPDLRPFLEWEYGEHKHEMPEPLKQAIEAMIARQRWFLKRDIARLQANQKAAREAVQEALIDTARPGPDGQMIYDTDQMQEILEAYARSREFEWPDDD